MFDTAINHAVFVRRRKPILILLRRSGYLHNAGMFETQWEFVGEAKAD